MDVNGNDQRIKIGRVIAAGWLLAMALAVGGLHFSKSQPESVEPMYAGKTVGQWLDAGYEDCAMAIQQIGAPAAPYVLAKVAREDPRYGTSAAYQNFRARIPTRLRPILPQGKTANFSEFRATSILLELGSPITPLLSRHLSDPNPAVRITCVRTLGILRNRGANGRQALAGLEQARQDPNPDVVAAICEVLGQPAAKPPTSSNKRSK
ncbi:MAG TPA: HEAT repeat domain-containing protein [Verrucomicrobiae bacterium]|jgi:hypothetical protein|nr:HEAT repeat domain-containing protein [Verrucomicrobiae bacterium]